MGLDNPVHIIFLLILLLLVFGAKRLPEMGRSLGAGMRGFKDSLSGDGAPTALTPVRTEVAAPATTAGAPAAVVPIAEADVRCDPAGPVGAAEGPQAPPAA